MVTKAPPNGTMHPIKVIAFLLHQIYNNKKPYTWRNCGMSINDFLDWFGGIPIAGITSAILLTFLSHPFTPSPLPASLLSSVPYLNQIYFRECTLQQFKECPYPKSFRRVKVGPMNCATLRPSVSKWTLPPVPLLPPSFRYFLFFVFCFLFAK
jgi:hypothetical protein